MNLHVSDSAIIENETTDRMSPPKKEMIITRAGDDGDSTSREWEQDHIANRIAAVWGLSSSASDEVGTSSSSPQVRKSRDSSMDIKDSSRGDDSSSDRRKSMKRSRSSKKSFKTQQSLPEVEESFAKRGSSRRQSSTLCSISEQMSTTRADDDGDSTSSEWEEDHISDRIASIWGLSSSASDDVGTSSSSPQVRKSRDSSMNIKDSSRGDDSFSDRRKSMKRSRSSKKSFTTQPRRHQSLPEVEESFVKRGSSRRQSLTLYSVSEDKSIDGFDSNDKSLNEILPQSFRLPASVDTNNRFDTDKRPRLTENRGSRSMYIRSSSLKRSSSGRSMYIRSSSLKKSSSDRSLMGSRSSSLKRSGSRRSMMGSRSSSLKRSGSRRSVMGSRSSRTRSSRSLSANNSDGNNRPSFNRQPSSFTMEPLGQQTTVDESERLSAYLDSAARRIQISFRRAKREVEAGNGDGSSTQDEDDSDETNEETSNVDEEKKRNWHSILTCGFILCFVFVIMTRRWIENCFRECFCNQKKENKGGTEKSNGDPEAPNDIPVDGVGGSQGQGQAQFQSGPTTGPTAPTPPPGMEAMATQAASSAAGGAASGTSAGIAAGAAASSAATAATASATVAAVGVTQMTVVAAVSTAAITAVVTTGVSVAPTTVEPILSVCGLPNPDVRNGRFTMNFEGFPRVLDGRESGLLETLVKQSYNEITLGPDVETIGCLDPLARVMQSISVVNQTLVEAPGFSLLEIMFDATISCDRCSPTSPLFSEDQVALLEGTSLQTNNVTSGADSGSSEPNPGLNATSDGKEIEQSRLLQGISFESQEFFQRLIQLVIFETEELTDVGELPKGFTKVSKAWVITNEEEENVLVTEVQYLRKTSPNGSSNVGSSGAASSSSGGGGGGGAIGGSSSGGGNAGKETNVEAVFQFAVLDPETGEVEKVTVEVTEEGEAVPTTAFPTFQPSHQPTDQPSSEPTNVFSGQPTTLPSQSPSSAPSVSPSAVPSHAPSKTASDGPTSEPSTLPSMIPSTIPSDSPSDVPSFIPSFIPSYVPSEVPSEIPSFVPSVIPSFVPSFVPSETPSFVPSFVPSETPSFVPSVVPSDSPSDNPSSAPSSSPSKVPTTSPSKTPTRSPTSAPTLPCGGKDLRDYAGSTVTQSTSSYDWRVTIGTNGSYLQTDTQTTQMYNIGTHSSYSSDSMSSSYTGGEDCAGTPRSGTLSLSWTTGPSSVSFTEPCGCCYQVDIQVNTATCVLP